MEKVIGKRLKLLRKHLKITQENFSNQFGINKKTLQNWEQGLTKPSLDNLKKIADETNVTVDWLIGRTEVKNSDCINKKLLNILMLNDQITDDLKKLLEKL